jgi:hypothetical protein
MGSSRLKHGDVLEWPFDIGEAPIGVPIDIRSSIFEIGSVIGSEIQPRSFPHLRAEEIQEFGLEEPIFVVTLLGPRIWK